MTAGNSSQLSDGASAVILASAGRAQELDWAPLARVVASASIGVDPTIMGIAPAYAMSKAIANAGLQPDDIDVFETHEAFATQVALGPAGIHAPRRGRARRDARIRLSR